MYGGATVDTFCNEPSSERVRKITYFEKSAIRRKKKKEEKRAASLLFIFFRGEKL